MPIIARPAALASYLALVLATSLATPAAGQLGTWPFISVSPPGTECPGPAPDAATSVPSTGLIHLWITPDGGDGGVNGLGSVTGSRFGIQWPDGWSVQSIETCRGTLESYACFSTGCAISIELEATGWDYTPAIHLVVDAPVPGRCSIVSNPLTGEYQFRDSYDDQWHDYHSHEGSAFIEVGDFPCSNPLWSPDDYCSLVVGYRGRPLGPTESYELHAGEARSDTVTIDEGECYIAPECGNDYGGGHPCGFHPYTEVPWITYQLVDQPTASSTRYRRIIDTAGLSVGTYVGGAGENGQCDHLRCGRNCHEVHLTVLPPQAIEPVSWGRIKALYHTEE